MKELDKEKNNFHFETGDMFRNYDLGGGSLFIITKVTDMFIQYLQFINCYFDDSYIVSRKRAKKSQLNKQMTNIEYCKKIEISAKNKIRRPDLTEFKYLPIQAVDLARLTNDELSVIHNIGLEFAIID